VFVDEIRMKNPFLSNVYVVSISGFYIISLKFEIITDNLLVTLVDM